MVWIETVLFVSTIVCTIVLAVNLYAFEMSDSINIQIVVAFLDTLLMVSITLGYFYLAEEITSNLLDIGEFLYDSPWYRLPMKQQSIILLPIQRAHLVFRLTGLGIFEASLTAFAMV